MERINISLDDESLAGLDALTLGLDESRSEVIRRALEALAEKHPHAAKAGRDMLKIRSKIPPKS